MGCRNKLITAYDQPALGAVFKLVSIEDSEGNMVIRSSYQAMRKK